ncbi:MAG: hypothetical protein CSA95_03345 [Bacteroidetes bacterium]|nr:MAG: hypothetical protein CSA95_03345 [Bacteroidota bacterium]
MKRIYILLSILLSMGFLACDNEVSTIGEWKEITVVYGLLNPNDSISYIKITKAFLGGGNALSYARISDSSEYPHKLEVSIEEYHEGNFIKKIDFDTTTIYHKEEGIFYSDAQQIYRAVTHQMLSDQNTYKLVIRNPKTGKLITAETPLVDENMIIQQPRINNITHPTINILDNEYTKAVSILSSKNGRRYEVYLTFNYEEVMKGSDIPVKKSIVWRSFPTRKSANANGGEELNFDFVTQSFWRWLNKEIPYADEAMEERVEKRYAGQIVFTFQVAEEQFNTYMEVNEPSLSIVQERPTYTNIENGIGIFSARYDKERAFYLSETSSNTLWKDYFLLKFVNPDNK